MDTSGFKDSDFQNTERVFVSGTKKSSFVFLYFM